MDNEFLVKLDKVNKRFRTHHFLQVDEQTNKRVLYKKKLVNAAIDIEFGIRKGEVFGLLGPNGAGKTTTVKMVSGLVKPDSGIVYVDGMNVEKKRLKILRKVGVVLEGTRTTIWPLTPLENLRYFGNLKDVRGSVLKKRAYELLEFIGLKEKMNIEVRRLSRGEKQKLAICIALIADPSVVLLDEPTTGLDVQSSRNIKDKIREMTREFGKCVLVTTHDMYTAQEICDRIGIINKGTLVTCKPTDQLLGLFLDPAFEFHVDREPGMETIQQIPGIHDIETQQTEEGPMLVVRVSMDVQQRSEAIYTVIEELRKQGLVLRTILQRQQTLENVFLKLTSKN